MRWKKKTPALPAKPTDPQTNDTRIVTKFLWWPTKINDETWWGETLTIQEKYVLVYKWYSTNDEKYLLNKYSHPFEYVPNERGYGEGKYMWVFDKYITNTGDKL